jgi:hypothetical protein
MFTGSVRLSGCSAEAAEGASELLKSIPAGEKPVTGWRGWEMGVGEHCRVVLGCGHIRACAD